MAFKKGQSGNPAGRAKGKQEKITLLKNELLALAPLALDSLRYQIASGDSTSIKLLFDKILPNIKAQYAAIELPNAGDESLATLGRRVIDLMASGGLPPDIGNSLLNTLANQSKVVEIEDLTKRIEQLESKR